MKLETNNHNKKNHLLLQLIAGLDVLDQDQGSFPVPSLLGSQGLLLEPVLGCFYLLQLGIDVTILRLGCTN